MTGLQSCLYVGEVVHRRVAPVKHSLRYKVYDLFLDLDDLASLNSRFRFLSYNRFNLFSIFDRHFGNGASFRDHVWDIIGQSGNSQNVKRVFVLCYPAVLGRVFNPLTSYYCYGADDKLCLMIYEVSNTFGERHSYVMPIVDGLKQHHAKKFYVSPFNRVEGEYDFAVQAPGAVLSLGISLRVDDLPIMQAWFKGERRQLNDRTLLRAFFSLPLQPLKVVVGIHWEALKLWAKGLRLVPRPAQLEPRISFVECIISKVEQKK